MNMRIMMTALVFFITSLPAAAEDEINSGFGKDYFAGDPHPAFENPSFFDIDSLAGIEPAAGDDGEPQTDESQPVGTEALSIPSSEESRATDTSDQ